MFLVCGEAFYDVFVDAETPGGFVLDARLGGASFNVALGLARMGLPAGQITGVGDDQLGRAITAAMTREGIDTRYLAAKPGARTTLGLVSLSAGGGASYAFYRHEAADTLVTPEDLPAALDGIEALIFGCLSILDDRSGESFLGLARRAAGRREGRAENGPLICLDPNIRPSVVPDMQLWRDRVEAFAASADFIKVSDQDLEFLYPGEAPDAVAARWRDGGARLVMMTRGAGGATAWGGWGAAVARPAPQITVADTVGAGDTYLAATLCALAERGLASPGGLDRLDAATVAQVMEFAMQAAAITCTRRGADLPRRAELAPPPA